MLRSSGFVIGAWVALGCGASDQLATEPTATVRIPLPSVVPQRATDRQPASPRTPAPWERESVSAGDVYEGAYLCSQGETHLTLRIRAIQDEQVEGSFEFAHDASGAHGVFTVVGTFRPATKRLELLPVKWVERPADYFMVGLAGNADHDFIRGKINDPSCGDFMVQRRAAGRRDGE